MNKSCFFEIHPFESKCFVNTYLGFLFPKWAGLQDTYAYHETFIGLKSSLEYSNLVVEQPIGKTEAVISALKDCILYQYDSSGHM